MWRYIVQYYGAPCRHVIDHATYSKTARPELWTIVHPKFQRYTKVLLVSGAIGTIWNISTNFRMNLVYEIITDAVFGRSYYEREIVCQWCK